MIEIGDIVLFVTENNIEMIGRLRAITEYNGITYSIVNPCSSQYPSFWIQEPKLKLVAKAADFPMPKETEPLNL